MRTATAPAHSLFKSLTQAVKAFSSPLLQPAPFLLPSTNAAQASTTPTTTRLQRLQNLSPEPFHTQQQLLSHLLIKIPSCVSNVSTNAYTAERVNTEVGTSARTWHPTSFSRYRTSISVSVLKRMVKTAMNTSHGPNNGLLPSSMANAPMSLVSLATLLRNSITGPGPSRSTAAGEFLLMYSRDSRWMSASRNWMLSPFASHARGVPARLCLTPAP